MSADTNYTDLCYRATSMLMFVRVLFSKHTNLTVFVLFRIHLHQDLAIASTIVSVIGYSHQQTDKIAFTDADAKMGI